MINPLTQSRATAVARILASLAAILFSALCTGCWVQSVYPFYEESDVVVDNLLTGSWMGLGEITNCTLNITLETSTRTYTITISKSPAAPANVQCDSPTFEGKLLQLGQQRFLDIAPDPEKSGPASLDTILKLDLENGNLALTPLDPDWIANAINEKAVRLQGRVQEFGAIPRFSSVTLISPTTDLREFLQKADTKSAFSETGQMRFSRK